MSLGSYEEKQISLCVRTFNFSLSMFARDLKKRCIDIEIKTICRQRHPIPFHMLAPLPINVGGLAGGGYAV